MLKTANLRILSAVVWPVVLFLALATHAQAGPRTATAQRTVRVEEPGDGAHHYMLPPINLDVIKAFADRVAGSERYALTKEPAELVVFIICLDTTKDDSLPEG